MTLTSPAPVIPPSPPARSERRGSARAGRIAAVASVVLVVWILLGAVPGPLGALVAVALPWTGLLVLGALAIALVRARRTLVLPIAAAVVWICAMLPALPSPGGAGGTGTLTVASQNVRANSGGAAASAEALAATGAQVVALTELDGDSRAAADDALADRYPHSYQVGTVGVWSTYPISDSEPLSLGLGWNRALRVQVDAPEGPVGVYLLHAASIRPGEQGSRDTMLTALAAEIDGDDAAHVIAVGDFNSAPTDPALGPLRAAAEWVRPTDAGLGLTWPAGLPVVRIDQVFQRGLSVVSSTTLPAGASDHLATVTTVRF